MSRLGTQEQAAIEAVAAHFSASWKEGDEGRSAASLTIAGRRIFVEVAMLRGKLAGQGDVPRPRLRFDKVALGFVGDLHAAISPVVPDGAALVLTVTAPIRLSSRTAAALEGNIRDNLARRVPRVETEDEINGNRIRVRLLKGVPRRVSKVMGFVHNPDTDPDVLLRLTRALAECVGGAADRRLSRKFGGERWLVIVTKDGPSLLETYRHVYSQLAISTGFAKIVMVFAGGRIGLLAPAA